MFELHERLRRDCIELGRFRLCRLLLMNECRYPWFILVPEVQGLTEIFQLSPDDQFCLIGESSNLATALLSGFAGDKMNIAAIGNLVPQLHVHHVVRHRSDEAWPGPVWGRFEPQPYEAEGLSRLIGMLRAHPPKGLNWFVP